MKKHYRTENDCLNCGTTLQGRFCYNCGQENLEVKESFGHMMNHAISDYFHFDHQFLHTIKPLFFKPGFLTNEYMAGRRAQYLHPVKMYIFISLVYFILLFSDRQSFFSSHAVKITTEQVSDSLKKAKGTSLQKFKNIAKIKVDTSYAGYLASQKKPTPGKRDGWLQQYLSRKSYALKSSKVGVKELVVEGLKHNFPKVMFLLLPFFAFLVSIAFRKNRKFFIEHLIFSFHLHSFIFLFLTLFFLLKMFIPQDWDGVITAINYLVVGMSAIYVFLAFRAVYHRSALRTITKMAGISIIYNIAGLFCFLAVIVVSLLMAV